MWCVVLNFDGRSDIHGPFPNEDRLPTGIGTQRSRSIVIPSSRASSVTCKLSFNRSVFRCSFYLLAAI